jgi:hypothetical protein
MLSALIYNLIIFVLLRAQSGKREALRGIALKHMGKFFATFAAERHFASDVHVFGALRESIIKV